MKVTNQDTIFSVSLATIRTYNHAMADLKACNEVADSLFSQKEKYKKLNQKNEQAIVLYDSINSNQQKQIEEKVIQTTHLEKQNKRLALKSKFFKASAIFVSIIATFEAGWILLLR